MSEIPEEFFDDANYTEMLRCSKKTKALIMTDCKKEFLKHHPELIGTKITQGQILIQIAIFYLKE